MSVLERIARYNHSLGSRKERPPMMKPKPLQSSDDMQGHSTFGIRRDIITQAFSPTIRHVSFDGSNIFSFGKRSPSPRADSPDSYESIESVESRWDKSVLLDLSNSVRASLGGERALGPQVEELRSFLETALKGERRENSMLDFDTIAHARLDKLLADIISYADSLRRSSLATELSLAFRVDISNAKSLRRAWRQRFREQYIMIDQYRSEKLIENRLKDITFNGLAPHDLGKWQTATKCPVSEYEGNLEFELGHWWLHLTCAERDGIVARSLEKPTKGRYGMLALPLLTGYEELVSEGTFKYVREGGPLDMHIPLISQVGRRIRVLRGHTLKSIWAPEAGVRYDGLYKIKQYGTKRDLSTNIHRLELTLERSADQKPVDDLMHIPKPAQIDDWRLFEKYEGDKIKLAQGEASYLDWKLKREEERLDREEWKRSRLFRQSFSYPFGVTRF